MLSRSLQTVAWNCCCSLPLLLIGCGPEFAEPASQFSSVAVAGEKQEEQDKNGQRSISKESSINATPDFSSVPTLPASSVLKLPYREEKTRYHEVVSGETLSAIARKYSVSAERFRKANLLNRSAMIQPGQLLVIPNSR